MENYNGVHLSTLEGLAGSQEITEATNQLRGLNKNGIPHISVLKNNPNLWLSIVSTGIIWSFKDNNNNVMLFGYNHNDDENNQDKPLVSLIKSGVIKYGGWSSCSLQGYNKDTNWCVYAVKRQTGGGWVERTAEQLANDTQLWNRIETIEKSSRKYPTPVLFEIQNQSIITLKAYLPILMTVVGAVLTLVASPVVAGLVSTALNSIKKLINGETNNVAGVLADVNNAMSPILNTPSNTDIAGFVTNASNFVGTKTKAMLPEEAVNLSNKGIAIYNSLASKDIPSLMGLHTNIDMYNLGSLDEFEDLTKIGEMIADAYSNGDIEKIARLTGDSIDKVEKVVLSVKNQDFITTAYTDFKVSPLAKIKEFISTKDSTAQQYFINSYSSVFNRGISNVNQITQILPNNKLITKMVFDDNNTPKSPELFRGLINILQGEATDPKDIESLTIASIYQQAADSNAKNVTYYVPSILPPIQQVKAGKIIKSAGLKVKAVDSIINKAIHFDKEFA